MGYKILLTNDDGPRSPLLKAFLDALSKQSWCSELRCVIPDRERSWIAQAITRTDTIEVSEKALGEHLLKVCTGTPADCVSLGLENLFEDRADFVFSGINIGTNCGLAFYLNSGTVGAARHGHSCAAKACGFSAKIPKEIFTGWNAGLSSATEAIEAVAGDIAECAAGVAKTLVEAGAWEYADFFSANLPWNANHSTTCKLTELADTKLGALFKEVSPNVFSHSFTGLKQGNNDGRAQTSSKLATDISTLEAGHISLTPIFYALTPAAEQCAALKCCLQPKVSE